MTLTATLHRQIAVEMLKDKLKPNESCIGIHDLPASLTNMLDRQAELVGNDGGVLQSRQAIAAIIVTWEYTELLYAEIIKLRAVVYALDAASRSMAGIF